MNEFSGETPCRRAIELTTEWLVMAFVSVMAVVSTLRLFGIIS